MRRSLLSCCLLLATPFLAAAKCTFFFSTGGSNPGPNDPNDTAFLAIEGHFVGPPVRGVAYQSGSLSGMTGENGEFRYEEGGTVSFFIGDIRLGGEVNGSVLVSPIDLVNNGSGDNTTVINIARLLQSLDAIPGDGVITIPASVQTEAVVTNETLFSSIQSLDFSDDQSFVNAASQLVAVLARDYPFTATLVDADAARQLMLDSIESWKMQQTRAAGDD